MDEADITLARLCIWREARGESKEGKRAVWNVLKNRVADIRWPDTLYEVVLQPKQFSSFNANDPNAVLWPKRYDPMWVECLEVIQEDEPDNTHGATNYFATYIPAPEWASHLTMTLLIGHHAFYK